MIRIVRGLNGSGKSALAALLALKSPLPVVTNMQLTDKHPKFASMRRLAGYEVRCQGNTKKCNSYGIWDLKIRNSLVILDEADIYFDSLDWSGLKGWPHYWFKQHRKYGLEIILVCQHVNTMYNRIRDLCKEYVLCTRDQGSDMPPVIRWLWPRSQYFWRRIISEDADMRKILSEHKFRTPHMRPYFDMYNSTAESRNDEFCPTCQGIMDKTALARPNHPAAYPCGGGDLPQPAVAVAL